MKYFVLWSKEAERRLDEIWKKASDPTRILSAAVELEHRLREDPRGEGESRDGSRRIAFEQPLGITFRIVDRLTVMVLAVWEY